MTPCANLVIWQISGGTQFGDGVSAPSCSNLLLTSGLRRESFLHPQGIPSPGCGVTAQVSSAGVHCYTHCPLDTSIGTCNVASIHQPKTHLKTTHMLARPSPHPWGGITPSPRAHARALGSCPALSFPHAQHPSENPADSSLLSLCHPLGGPFTHIPCLRSSCPSRTPSSCQIGPPCLVRPLASPEVTSLSWLCVPTPGLLTEPRQLGSWHLRPAPSFPPAQVHPGRWMK